MHHREPTGSIATTGRPLARGTNPGSFAKSVSEQGYSLASIHRSGFTAFAACFSRWLKQRKGSDCAASAPIIWFGIYDIALDTYDLAMEMMLPSGISSAFCARRRA